MAEMFCGRWPNEPFFAHLLENARKMKHVIIHDSRDGVDADYGQLLNDVLRMQNVLRQSLPENVFDPALNLLHESNPYILILSAGNYQFVVAALCILSIGGAFAPIPTGLLPEETFYMWQKSRAICILADQKNLHQAKECQKYATSRGMTITIISINFDTSPKNHTHSEPCFEIDQQLTVAPHRPAFILFTSGTSGPPKGVVHTRRLLYNTHTSSKADEVILNYAAVDWGSSLLTLMGGVLGGARTEIITQDATTIWERLRKGGVTTLGFVPYFLAKMRDHFLENLSQLPLDERCSYVRGAKNLRYALVRGSMPDPGLLRFWRDSLGTRLHVCYGSTELGGAALKTTDDTDLSLERCIGRPVPGVTLKLSCGDHGELLIKKSVIFSHYLDSEDANSVSFDSDGFYKTGDLVRRVLDDYVLEGRAATDYIRYKALRVPILQVETYLLQLPFISEGCILPVSDTESGERVAALVRFRAPEQPHTMAGTNESQTPGKTHLQTLRSHLATALPIFMLPTVLRILRDGEEIPRTVSLKVIRRKAAELYFPLSVSWELPTDVEVWDVVKSLDGPPLKAWDWAGLSAGPRARARPL